MHFSRTDHWFSAVMITGPRHVLLQVQLGDGEQADPAWELSPPVSGEARQRLDEAAITAQVLGGVGEANRRLGACYTVTHIRCVEDDNGTPAMYGQMAAKLIDYFHDSGALA